MKKVYYYSLNAMCKKGINMSALFDIVHAANMAKRDPATGQFLKRKFNKSKKKEQKHFLKRFFSICPLKKNCFRGDDGKIIKPAGWKPPNVEAEIERQMKQGSFAEVNKENVA